VSCQPSAFSYQLGEQEERFTDASPHMRAEGSRKTLQIDRQSAED
jgi:hypothetical protein